jgi:hypothetical protein
MKTTFTLFLSFCLFFTAKSQVILNELYTDPGSGKHEFFELYNTSTSASGVSLNNYTIITYFEISGQQGFYVMDLPNMTIGAKDFFVGAAALPFNYQGVSNSTAADFSWNSASFTTNGGYIKKWVKGGINLLDGNLSYDQQTVPANFNDFFCRISGSGASYTIFVYNNGQLVNSFIGGAGGSTTLSNTIVNMPQLYVDMSGSSPDFTVNFSGYGSLPIESTTQDAGSDNGYIRSADGACGQWKKSSSSVQHTPKASNGSVTGTSGSVSVASAITPGTSETGSTVNYDVVAASSSAFPIEIQVYLDNGSISGKLDATDTYVESNTETIVSQGPFTTHFYPYNASVLLVVKTNAGCIDKIIYIPNSIALAINLAWIDAYNDENKVTLKWTIEENESADRFEIQRSFDGKDFSTASVVFATQKEGTENYLVNDVAPLVENIVYRLKMVDENKKERYSKSFSFKTIKDKTNSLVLYSNPVKDQLQMGVELNNAGSADVKVMDMSGRIMLQQKMNCNKGNNLLSVVLPSSVKNGIYIVDVFDGQSHHPAKFVKQ